MNDLVERLRIKAGVMEMGEKIAWGSDTALMREAADALEKVSEVDFLCDPVGWQFYQDSKWWNGDDRIKDHRKNTEEAGIPVRDVYTTPQSAPNVSELVKAIESLLPYVVTDYAGCRGDKCRELWCLSCTPEDTATDAVLDAREAYRKSLSTIKEYQNKEGGCE